MQHKASIRAGLTLALALGACSVPGLARWREPQPGAAKGNHNPSRAGGRSPASRPNQEHLQQWMERRQTQPVQQQLHDLENEPGFHDLPAQTQQRMRDRLTQLNSMNPQQRDRILERNEALERLPVPLRQQWRSAVQNLNAMPLERRRMVSRAVIDLRAMPPDQRQAAINSDRFRSQFSDSERWTVSSILAAEPYNASPAPPQ